MSRLILEVMIYTTFQVHYTKYFHDVGVIGTDIKCCHDDLITYLFGDVLQQTTADQQLPNDSTEHILYLLQDIG